MVEIDLMFHQLGHQLDSDSVSFTVTHPHAVGRVKQRDLRRRPADGQQVLGPADVPTDGGARILQGPATGGRGVQKANVQMGDAAHELIIDDELPALVWTATLFRPDQGAAE